MKTKREYLEPEVVKTLLDSVLAFASAIHVICYLYGVDVNDAKCIFQQMMCAPEDLI